MKKRIHDDIIEAAKERLFVAKQFETSTQQQLKSANIALERAHFRVRDTQEVYKMAQRSLEDAKKFLEVVEKRCEEEDEDEEESSSSAVKSGNGKDEHFKNKDLHEDEERDCNNNDTNHTTLTPVLPEKYTEALLARMQKLISMFADEEQMNGQRIFYWNIMCARHMQSIAMSVPLTIEELAECCVGIESSVLERYGERLIRNLTCFIEQERLERYIHINIRPNPEKNEKEKESCLRTSRAGAGVEEEKKVQFEISCFDDNDDVGEEEETETTSASELLQSKPKQMRLMYHMTTEEEEKKVDIEG